MRIACLDWQEAVAAGDADVEHAYFGGTVRLALRLHKIHREMQKPAQQGFPALLGWLAEDGIEPTGAPFYNYRRIDMAGTLDVEAGIPVDRIAEPDGNVEFGTLPAGRYAVVTHTGNYDGLYDATAMLIGWAKERGVTWDCNTDATGDHFACRLEIYETAPDEEPDPNKWVTRLAIKTAG